MDKVSQSVEYKVGKYRIQIEEEKNHSSVYVFDDNQNIIISFDSIEEAQEICGHILKVVAKVEGEKPNS